MATGCCGVKKQKLNSAVISAKNATGSYVQNGSHCNGLLNKGWASRSSNGAYVPSPDYDDESSSSVSLSNHCQSLSPRSARRQPPRIICFDMVVFCFDVLYSYLHSTEPPNTPKFTNDHFPLFVTWKMGKDKKLRGCIGTFNSTSLHEGLREYAITSACKDSRFEPINVDEFARLHCSVSLLMDFEVADHYLDWEIGLHGIRIEFFTEKGSKKAATYLPEVAIEQGWNQIQTIDSLLRKGGFKGTITPEIRGNVCLIRFQSEKMTVSCSEYLSHKKQRTTTTCSLIEQQRSDQRSTTLLPPIKSPALNGSVGFGNLMDVAMSSIAGQSSLANGYCHRSSHNHQIHQGHGSPYSVTSALNDGHTEHRACDSNWWRNRSPKSQRGTLGGRLHRHPSMNATNLTVSISQTYMPPPNL